MTTIAPTTSIARASSRAGTRGLTTRAGGASSRVQVGNYSREGAHAPSGVRLAGPMRGNGRGGSAVVRAMGPEELEAAQLWSVAGLGLFIGIAAVGSGLKGEPEPCPACAQRGGEECIFCTGTGRREAPIKVSKRDFNDDSILGLTRRNPLECTACKGTGMILCKTCRGTGFK